MQGQKDAIKKMKELKDKEAQSIIDLSPPGMIDKGSLMDMTGSI